MEGLEVSEVNSNRLERTTRIDSEFYSKGNLVINDTLLEKGYAKLTELVSVSDGNHMSISEKFQDSGIPYYRGQDIHSYIIEKSNPICIDKDTFNTYYMKRSHLQKGDVLLSIVGTIGGVSLVTSNNPATCNCKLAILRPNKINGFYLSVFLKSKYGQEQIKRYTRGAVQKGLILEDFDQLLVSIFSTKFQEIIQNLIEKLIEKSQQADSFYAQAEHLLLEELGLKDWQPAKENINIKSFKESFLTSCRLDAEYYQPKYEEVVEQIKSKTYNYLDEIVSIKKSIEPGSDVYSEEGVPFLRVSDYNKFKVNDPEKKLSSKFYKNNKRLIDSLKSTKETILFSKDGSVGVAYMLRSDADFITSGAILHLNVKDNRKVVPGYLTLVLNSELVQMQAERDAGGSIILHWRVGEIEKVLVPIIAYSKQLEIAQLVEQSFALKQESEHLLEVAKRAVEIAIEEGEEKAMEYVAINNK